LESSIAIFIPVSNFGIMAISLYKITEIWHTDDTDQTDLEFDWEQKTHPNQ